MFTSGESRMENGIDRMVVQMAVVPIVYKRLATTRSWQQLEMPRMRRRARTVHALYSRVQTRGYAGNSDGLINPRWYMSQHSHRISRNLGISILTVLLLFSPSYRTKINKSSFIPLVIPKFAANRINFDSSPPFSLR